MKTNDIFPLINYLTTNNYKDHNSLTCHAKLSQIQEEFMNHKQYNAMKL